MQLLPPADEKRPSAWECIRFYLTAVLPWVVLYEFTAHLHLPGTAFQFQFEDRLPIFIWTAPIYQSIYVVVALAPWLAPTRRDLRRFTMSVWLALAVVFPIYWIIPSQAPRRPLADTNWIAHLLRWERNAYPPTEAFPSFHVLWAIFLVRVIRPLWLGGIYAAAIAVSCISTGMHYIPDVLAAFALAPVLEWLRRVWDTRLARS